MLGVFVVAHRHDASGQHGLSGVLFDLPGEAVGHADFFTVQGEDGVGAFRRGSESLVGVLPVLEERFGGAV